MAMNLVSRLRVAASRAVLPWLRIPTPLSFVGAGASLSLCRAIAASGVQRGLVVTDRPLRALGTAGPMLQALRDAFIARVRRLIAEMGIPTQVQALRSADFDRIVDTNCGRAAPDRAHLSVV